MFQLSLIVCTENFPSYKRLPAKLSELCPIRSHYLYFPGQEKIIFPEGASYLYIASMFPIETSLKIKCRTNAISRCTKYYGKWPGNKVKHFSICLKAIVKHLDRCLYERKELIHSLRPEKVISICCCELIPFYVFNYHPYDSQT